jgi:hypothetical protein
MTYCAQARKDGWLISLPEAVHTERAASGADGRTYCWGETVEESDCCMVFSHGDSPQPTAVGAFPKDESPFGIVEMSGNANEFLLNRIGPADKNWRMRRGGAWILDFHETRVSYLWGSPPDWVPQSGGFRLCCYPVLPLKGNLRDRVTPS